ncbi:MAG: hypothetical protein AABW64_02775 [Nanoarchaeota archaeon]
MEYTRASKWKLLPKIAVLGGILLALFLAGYYTGYLREDCEQDKVCFDENAKECRPAELTLVKNNNVYSYWIGNSLGKTCEVHIKLLRVEAGAAPEFRALLEGKEMTCKIPKENLAATNVDEMERLMGYCHGELKEGLYELIIQRLYEGVVGQLSGILREAEKTLKKENA